jgi:hypothetical protein
MSLPQQGLAYGDERCLCVFWFDEGHISSVHLGEMHKMPHARGELLDVYPLYHPAQFVGGQERHGPLFHRSERVTDASEVQRPPPMTQRCFQCVRCGRDVASRPMLKIPHKYGVILCEQGVLDSHSVPPQKWCADALVTRAWT